MFFFNIVRKYESFCFSDNGMLSGFLNAYDTDPNKRQIVKIKVGSVRTVI